jgi:hypothetical protein
MDYRSLQVVTELVPALRGRWPVFSAFAPEGW